MHPVGQRPSGCSAICGIAEEISCDPHFRIWLTGLIIGETSGDRSLIDYFAKGWTRPWFQVALLLILTVLIHHSVFLDGFYWDDRAQILEGKLSRSWSNIPKIFGSEVWRNVGTAGRLEHASVDTYRPLFNLSLLVDYQLFGLAPWWYHTVNLLIHLLNVVLLHRCLLLMNFGGIALPTSALFALHPATTTCIHYVSSRPDSAATCLSLGALVLAIESQGRRHLPLILMCMSFLGALLWKETAILMPVVLPSMYWVFGPKTHIRGVSTIAGLLLATLGLYFLLRLNALGDIKAVEGNSHIAKMLVHFPLVLGRFVQVFLGITSALPLRSFEVTSAPYSPLTWWVVAVFYAFFGLAIFRGLFFRQRWAGAVLWVFLTMAPPVAAVVQTEIADGHYFYMPTLGGAVLCATMVEVSKKLSRPHGGGLRLALIVLSVCAWYSNVLSNVFLTEVTFYRGIIDSGKVSPLAHYNLANAYMRLANPVDAIAQYRRVLSNEGLAPKAHNNISVSLMQTGNLEESERHARAAVALKPDSARYRSNLGLVLLKQKKIPEGARQVERALKLDPSYPSALDLARQLCTRKLSHGTNLCSTKPAQ